MKRRTFIISAIGGVTLGCLGWSLGRDYGGVDSRPGAAPLAKFTRRSRALGTEVAITVYHRDSEMAAQAADAALAAIDRVENAMSLYRPGSEICQLNQHGTLENPSPEFLEVLRTALDLSRRTQGAFDVTVQPLWELYTEASKRGQAPELEAIRAACAKVGWRQIAVSEKRVDFRRDGVRITLNGLAQGYAADVARRALIQHGVRSALIDAGEIGLLGERAGEGAWRIGLKHPRRPDELLGLAQLRDRALATSGDYESRFSSGFDEHHLFDPRTGHSPSELASVSVAAQTALEADALSTAAFVLGLDRGRTLIESTPGADALFVTKTGRRERTASFPFRPS